MAAAGLLSQVGSAQALDVTLGSGGAVSLELLSSDAVFHNTLALVSPAGAVFASGCRLEGATGLAGLSLMSEKNSQHGCRVSLDSDASTPGVQGFAAGTVLKFAMCAQEDTDPACEDIWASDPASNGDNLDHVRTTPLHATDFPGQIFQLGWEDQPNGGDQDFNDLVAVVRVESDTDGDGLWDDWERFGIDTDGDGVVDLDLPGLGANPLHKDVFIEVDWMDCATAGGDCAAGDTHDHRPRAAAIAAAVQAFSNGRPQNPDGVPGVTLHIDVSNAIPHQNLLNINNLCFSGGAGIGSFDAVKQDPANFGPNNPRRFAYHYSLWTHQEVANNTTSGCAELPGNDFQISFGGWNVGRGDIDGDGLSDDNVGSIAQQAGTLIHELGHNLNLHHGGADDLNLKPNFLSAMNYRFQTAGVPPTDLDGAGPLRGRIDYSGGALATLIETNLSEPPGMGLGADNSFYVCPNGNASAAVGNNAIDWNCNGANTDNNVTDDVNGDRGCVGAGANGTLDTTATGDDLVQNGQIIDGPDRTCNTAKTGDDTQTRPVANVEQANLNGHDDWANISYALQATGSFDDGYHDESARVLEMDYPLHQKLILPDLELTGTVAPSSVVTGTQLIYALKLRNLQPHAAADVVLRQQLPSGVTVLSCSADQGGVCGQSGGMQTVTFRSLAGGEQASIEIHASVACATADGSALDSTIDVQTSTEESDVTNNHLTLHSVSVNPPPVLSAVTTSPTALGPPNHKMVPVALGYTATDNCGTPTCTLSVSSNEPIDGTGDGDTSPDWSVQDPKHASVRAERAGNGSGRIYTFQVLCADSAGGRSTGSAHVTVPH